MTPRNKKKPHKLVGYLTPTGWFGEMPDGRWILFPTEEEWKEAIGEKEDEEC